MKKIKFQQKTLHYLDYWNQEFDKPKQSWLTFLKEKLLHLFVLSFILLFLLIPLSMFFPEIAFLFDEKPHFLMTYYGFLTAFLVIVLGYFIILEPQIQRLKYLIRKKDVRGVFTIMGITKSIPKRIVLGVLIGFLSGICNFSISGSSNIEDIIGTILMGPLFEEFIYRSLLISMLLVFIQTYRLSKTKFRIAVVLALFVSSSIFAWMHPPQEPLIKFYPLMLMGGLIFGFMYLVDWKSIKRREFYLNGSIWVSIATHMTANLTITALSLGVL